MKLITCIFIILALNLGASEKLIFGAISTIEPKLMKEKLLPIIKYLEESTGREIEFQTGYNYVDTINKFANGTFDFGYIGPSPYIKTKIINKDAINIILGLKNSNNNPFKSVLTSKKDSSIEGLKDIKNHSFAFGSPESTLSYFVPMDMLIRANVIKKIKKYDFLGRHDKVAQYVIMGRYDAGAVKQSIAQKYSKYLQVIAKSNSLPDFLIVSGSSLDKKLVKKIKNALLNLKDKKILGSLKKSAIGFEERKNSDYDELRGIMKRVN
ncbi:phosphate/phosphite/phosphonate ABC transporter substrate-binding protein, partial [Sulfurimonas sp.]|uniref:phosphate/phosphite/phosphonate ABC transporter substrate-binding protein n=1 Tax=Sulfurimonas sp. TaxID=2022749 RepID=UPI0025DBB93C